ncbi:MAG: ATP-dependent Clp protease ATP-binding subunit [Clostridia bacterium]|nr:ATP-dependent Clp protease ATP-binding subunit [Clostridia bacterium]
MLCVKCKKRMAVVFVARMENGTTKNEGYCLKCAKELGLAPVDDMLSKMGISPEEFDSISSEMMEMMGEEGDFSEGGAPSMSLLGKMMGKGEEEADEKPKDGKKPKYKFLSQYCIDLTQRARDGKIDKVIGREEEIYRAQQILCRRTKNNPCLIGEPGVGKTAIAEGLASRIAAGNVPAKLRDKQVFLLDLTALIAGTQFRGQFESRVKGLIEEVKKIGNIILVIDEVHNLVGAGESEGSMNAANMLKPALSRGEIQVIGATTLNEYRKHIEKDAALERRFQTVMVEEPSIDDAMGILRGIKEHYETFHNLTISEDIVRKSVTLSERYVTDRYLPDKAIDLLDEACANAALKNKAFDALYDLEKQVAATEEKIAAIKELPTEQMTDDTYKELAESQAELLRITAQRDVAKEQSLSTVTLEDLARVIELWTGVPTGKIIQSETDKLRDLEKVLGAKIKGQEEAISAIAAAVRRARAALTPRKRAVSFIFTGPTGVGKTELVKVLAKELFDTPETLIRLDMSEFMEKHSVSRIIGSPPGYVGYDEAGQLTEKIRRKPYSVVLFDEIEKAHPDVLNILLQILDEGRVTDAHGRTVSFEHAVIVMTSNAGSQIGGTAAGFGASVNTRSKDKAMKALSDFLRPEFINRVDEIIVFNPLPQSVFADIAEGFMKELQEGLEEQGITLAWDDAALSYIAKESFSEKYGARNVRRYVERQVEDRLVRQVFEVGRFTEVSVSSDGSELKFEIK